MSDIKNPDQARASPQPRRSHRLSTRFTHGGERLEFDRIKIIKDDLNDSSEDSTETGKELVDEPAPAATESRSRRSISVMLILQILTLLVAIVALL